MSADDLLRWATNAAFVVVFVAVLNQAIRQRRRVDVDAAILFGALALIIVESQLLALLNIKATGVVTFGTVLILMTLPYLQLRLVDDFSGVPRRVHAVALAGLFFSVVGLVVVPVPYPPWFGLPLVAYFTVLQVYAAVAFVREARRSSGSTRPRMVAAALGSSLFGLTLLAAGIAPLLQIPSDLLTRVLGLSTAIAYLAAFSPPPFLLRAWQEPELRAFLNAVTSVPPTAETPVILRTLEKVTTLAMGATTAGIGLWNASAAELRFEVDGVARAVQDGEGFLGRVLRSERALMTTDVHRVAPELLSLATGDKVGAILAAPMNARARRIGVLAIFARRAPIFAVDDLARLQVLADQGAMVLDASSLYVELASANEKLAEATRVKTQFLANMSHELRTPLNAILGFSELLEEQLGTALEPRQQRFLRNIRDSGQHLLELVNEILDLSKVEAGRVDLRPETMRLSTLIEPTIAAARTAADARGLDFAASVPGERGVNLDPGRVRQVLYNLLSNAVKFTPRGGRVWLRVAVDGTTLRIEVGDTGIGIPTELHDRVFGTFERLHEGKSDATGTGLGLALTKRLVELHGGAVTFESAEGRGTTFRVVLPDCVVESVGGARLLVVDDEPADAALIVALASELGLRAEVVTTAATALDVVRRDPPIAVVLDLRLRDERGERVLEAIKADPATRSIPVIVVSVDDDEGQSRPLGADDHLTKPIDSRRLQAWLRRVASRAEARVAAAAR